MHIAGPKPPPLLGATALAARAAVVFFATGRPTPPLPEAKNP
jgi:hypothetical protein